MRAWLHPISVQTHSQTPSSPVVGDLTTAGHTWDLQEKGRVSETYPFPKLHQTRAYPTVQLGGKNSRVTQWGVELGPVFLYLSICPL